MKYFYGVLCLFGAALPYAALLPWLFENGPNLKAFLEDAASTNIGAAAWLDVVVSAAVLTGFIVVEGRRQHIKRWWLALLGTYLVGVSLGLPLFLLLRELQFENHNHSRNQSQNL